MNVAAHFAQMLKIFARTMANFSALGMQPHPHAVRLWERSHINRTSKLCWHDRAIGQLTKTRIPYKL